jgi:hypothetical protein
MTDPTISRRAALAGALAVALPSRLLAESLEKVHVSIIPVYDVAPLYAAIVKGYFSDVGLDVDTAPTAGGVAGIPALIGGSVDIAYGNVVSVLLAVQQGLDLKVIAAGTKNTGFATDKTEIMVAADSGIKTAKDLEGKSLDVNTRNNVIWLYAVSVDQEIWQPNPDLAASTAVLIKSLSASLPNKGPPKPHWGISPTSNRVRISLPNDEICSRYGKPSKPEHVTARATRRLGQLRSRQSSRVIDTAAPIDAAPQKTASSQNFTDLGIPNESQLRAVGMRGGATAGPNHSAGLVTIDGRLTVSRASISRSRRKITSMRTKKPNAPANDPPLALIIAPISHGTIKAENRPNTSA